MSRKNKNRTYKVEVPFVSPRLFSAEAFTKEEALEIARNENPDEKYGLGVGEWDKAYVVEVDEFCFDVLVNFVSYSEYYVEAIDEKQAVEEAQESARYDQAYMTEEEIVLADNDGGHAWSKAVTTLL